MLLKSFSKTWKSLTSPSFKYFQFQIFVSDVKYKVLFRRFCELLLTEIHVSNNRFVKWLCKFILAYPINYKNIFTKYKSLKNIFIFIFFSLILLDFFLCGDIMNYRVKYIKNFIYLFGFISRKIYAQFWNVPITISRKNVFINLY